MRVAIVGAGISGLACAHLLHREHDVVVFEAADTAGGHAHTVAVPTDSGVHAVDTGFIVFNDRNYPGFKRLLSELDVPTQPCTMSFGVSDGCGFEYNGASPNGLFARRRHLVSPAFHGMIADLVRFNRNARRLLGSDADPSLGEWLADGGYGAMFVDRLITPQVSAVWSSDPRSRWSFPARFLAAFFDNHGMLGFRRRPRWRTVRGGSRCGGCTWRTARPDLTRDGSASYRCCWLSRGGGRRWSGSGADPVREHVGRRDPVPGRSAAGVF